MAAYESLGIFGAQSDQVEVLRGRDVAIDVE
jgi:hypothetical protein